MAKMNMLGIEQNGANLKVENEIDDVFVETVENRVKTEERKQIQSYIENDERLETKYKTDSSDLPEELYEHCFDIRKGNSISNIFKCSVDEEMVHDLCNLNHNVDVENKYTVTIKCLNNEDTDDVFDEELERAKTLRANLGANYTTGFENIATGIKIEADNATMYNAVNLHENLGSIANMKQEDDLDSHRDMNSIEESVNFLLPQNKTTNDESSVEVHEEKIKLELNIENENPRINKYCCTKCAFQAKHESDLKIHCLSHNSSNNEKTLGTQIEIEKNPVNENYIININSDSEIILCSNVENRKNGAVPTCLNDNIKDVRTFRKQNEEITKIKSNSNNLIENSKYGERSEKEFENLNKNHLPNDKEQSDKNKRQKENKTENGFSDTAKKKLIENTQDEHKLSSNVNFSIETNSKINRNFLMEHTSYENRPEKENKKKVLLRRKGDLDKKLLGGEKKQNSGKYALKNVTEKVGNSEELLREDQYAVTNIAGQENCEGIAGNKKKTQNENNSKNTCSKTEYREPGRKSLDKSEKAETDKSLEVRAKNASDQIIKNTKWHKDQNIDTEYICTKCSFKAKHKSILKQHLLKHKTEFSSSITSLVKKANLCPNQLEKTENVNRSNQTKKEIIENIVNNENEKNSKSMSEKGSAVILNNIVQLQNVEPQENQISEKNYNGNHGNHILHNQAIGEVFNREIQTICQNKEVSRINLKEQKVMISAYNSEKSKNENIHLEKNESSKNIPCIKNAVVEERTKFKNIPTINIQYSCIQCSFKAKSRTIFKRHLMNHGMENFSGIISFLDLVKNDKVSNHINEDNDNNAQSEDEKLENKNEDSCTRSQSSSQITTVNNKGNETVDNSASENLNIEENIAFEHSEIVVLGKEKGLTMHVDKNKETENEDVLTTPANINTTSENCKNEVRLTKKNVSSKIKLKSIIKNKRKVVGNNKISESVNEEKTISETLIGNEEKDKEILPVSKSEENITAVAIDTIYESVKNQITESKPVQLLNENEIKRKGNKNKRKRVVKNRSVRTKKIKLEPKNATVYCCDECPYQSDKKRYFNNHKIIHSKDVIKCSFCDFITNIQRNLTAHMLVHLKPEEVEMYKCPHCPYQTKRRCDLPTHMILHKKVEEIRMFQCDKCPYQSKRKSNLRVHQVCHKSTNETPSYNCAVCSYKSNRKNILKAHMIVHQKEEETCWYKCEQCSYITKYKSGLIRHSLVHKKPDEIKTYDCPVCFYKAKHKGHLKTHLLIHEDAKEREKRMHHCDHCSYKSLHRNNLSTHMLQHKKIEEINMMKCGHCPYVTKLKCNLLKHINRIHRS